MVDSVADGWSTAEGRRERYGELCWREVGGRAVVEQLVFGDEVAGGYE